MSFFKEKDYKRFNIQFDKISDVKEFVAVAEKCKGYVTISSKENYICNGKSIMGIFGLNLSNPVEVSCTETDYNTVHSFCDSAGLIVGD